MAHPKGRCRRCDEDRREYAKPHLERIRAVEREIREELIKVSENGHDILSITVN